MYTVFLWFSSSHFLPDLFVFSEFPSQRCASTYPCLTGLSNVTILVRCYRWSVSFPSIPSPPLVFVTCPLRHFLLDSVVIGSTSSASSVSFLPTPGYFCCPSLPKSGNSLFINARVSRVDPNEIITLVVWRWQYWLTLKDGSLPVRSDQGEAESL